MSGAGGYADNDAGAVSTTGDGESFMKMCVAHQVITLMRLGKQTTSYYTYTR